MYKRQLQYYGYPIHDTDAYRFFVGNGINKLFERALPENERSEENISKIRSQFVPYYDKHNADFSRPYPGIAALLLALQNDGRKIAVASNKYQAATRKLIAHYFPEINFVEVLGQREGIPAKPDPSIVNDIIATAGVTKEEVLYVGDSNVDMQTAHNAGVTAVGVAWGFRPRTELEALHPAHIIEKAEELIPLLDWLGRKYIQTADIVKTFHQRTIRYVIKGLRYLATEIDSERLKINGFYSDWTMPTFHIIRFLLYAFMIVMIYPYLPGADSGAFQGISVFVGLIISLGSSTVIGNFIEGFITTYIRPSNWETVSSWTRQQEMWWKKTAFVTRIRTSKSARTYGLIIHSEVTIGYDAPWRKVHQLLIDAALATPEIQADPEPFVLKTSLSDWYPVYQVNAYIKDADKMAAIYSVLHQNIQDYFNKAGIEIMSPHYIATRDGNEITIPKETAEE